MIWKSSRFQLIVLGIFLLLCGAVILPVYRFAQNTAETAAKWPVAEATVRFADVEKDNHISSQKPATYRQEIIYDFEVNGAKYSGEAMYIGNKPPSWSSEASATEALPKIGSVLRIHYNPANPKQCVARADPRPPAQYWLGFTFRSTLEHFK